MIYSLIFLIKAFIEAFPVIFEPHVSEFESEVSDHSVLSRVWLRLLEALSSALKLAKS